ncbi:hypothetical protein [Pseudooceanicola sp. 200-1SW]|uniref:hypothetical protein n=1 Tax=Pseudooceanicola sp. 200-1SW TaxID=3425949 RepID=UPI003D7FF599
MSQRRYWDPFDGTIRITPIETAKGGGARLPNWLKRLPPLAILGTMLWLLIAAVRADSFPVLPTICTSLAFASLFLFEKLENTEGRRRARYVRLARANGWGFTDKLLERQVEFGRAIDGDGDFERRTQLQKSERMLKIEAHLPELTKLRVGAFMGALLDSEFWGPLPGQPDQPMWMAVGTTQMEAGLGRARTRRDTRGGQGGYGQLFTIVGAFQLGRDTGIRAAIAPESLFSLGPLDRDLKTESTAFNAAFRIAGRAIAGGRAAAEVEQEVLRILTPATQTSLLDLKARHAKVGCVVEAEVLYVMVQDWLSGGNATEAALDRLLPEILAEFQAAQQSFRAYIE